MVASALLHFVQGVTDGGYGNALIASTGAAVTISNANNTGVASWRIELLYAPPGSMLERPLGDALVLAQASTSVPTTTLTPQVGFYGCYRIRLTVWDAPGFTGLSSEDIRNIGIALPATGLIKPPFQDLPKPLPLLGSGLPGEQPDELNFGGQIWGWSGEGSGGKMLNAALNTIDLLTAPAVDRVGRLANEGLRDKYGTANQVAYVQGYNVAHDGGGGNFRWNTASAANNDGTVIVPGVAFGADTAGAHWERVADGPLNVKWFGAVGNYIPLINTGGDYDDAGFQRALLALSKYPNAVWAQGKHTLLVPDGIYKIATPIDIGSNQKLIGASSPILWGSSPSLAAVIRLRISGAYDLIYGAKVQNIIIQGDGVTALDLYAMEGCVIDVTVGGKFTYAIKSEYNGANGGVAYNCDVKLTRFLYSPINMPILSDYGDHSPDNGVWIYGAWTSTELRVDLFGHPEYSVRVVGAGPSAGIGSLRVTGLIQGNPALISGARTALFAQGIANLQVSELYGEANFHDIVLDNLEMSSISDSWMGVTATNCTGLTCTNVISVNADKTNIGTRVMGGLATSANPPEVITTDSVGIVTDIYAREVARGGVWTTGVTVSDSVNLVPNGDMRRWTAGGALWGLQGWGTTIPTTKCGVGLGDVTRTEGSPYCAKFVPTGGSIASAWKLTGPLAPGFLNTEMTVSFKLKIINPGIACAVEFLDGSVTGWSAGSAPSLFGAAGISPSIPCENGFYLFRWTFKITSAMLTNGVSMAILCYDTGSFYLSELQAFMGKASPRHYLPEAATYDNSVRALVGGGIAVSGTTPPSTDPFYGAPILPGDWCQNTGGGPIQGWTCVGAGPVWAPVTATGPTSSIVGRTSSAGLRGMVGTSAGELVHVSGYNSPNDGGGGTFRWNTTSLPNDDGLHIVPGVTYGSATAGAGWERVYDGPLNVKWFGAVGDYVPDAGTGGTNDDAAFQRALATMSHLGALNTKVSLVIPDGIYKITTTIDVLSGYKIYGEGRPILWAVGVSPVRFGQGGTMIFGAEFLDITVLGTGTSAIIGYAMQACRIRAWIGGSFTYGVFSKLVSLAGGVAYDCDIRIVNFAYNNQIHPFSAPAIPTEGIHIEGAWTNTDLFFEWYVGHDYGIYHKQVAPGGAGSLFISGMVQGTGFSSGLGTAVYLEGASNAVIRNFYGEGNLRDIDLVGCFGVIVESSFADVRARTTKGLRVADILRLDVDNTCQGVTVSGTLATGAGTSSSLLTNQLGVVGTHYGSEVGHQGYWVAPVEVAGENLVVNGDMRRWTSGGVMWGLLPWLSNSTTKCGVGLGDTTHTNGSPYCTLMSAPSGGGWGVKLTGPLPDAYLGTEITVSCKIKGKVPAPGAFLQLCDNTIAGIDGSVSLGSWTVLGNSVSLGNSVGSPTRSGATVSGLTVGSFQVGDYFKYDADSTRFQITAILSSTSATVTGYTGATSGTATVANNATRSGAVISGLTSAHTCRIGDYFKYDADPATSWAQITAIPSGTSLTVTGYSGATSGPASIALNADSGIPCENGFFIHNFSRTINQAMATNGIQLVSQLYTGVSFYISELQACFGRAAPREYRPGRSHDGAITVIDGVAITTGTAVPGSTDPFYSATWITGDRCLNTAGAPISEWVVTDTTPTWEPVIIDQGPKVVSGTTYTLLASDDGRILNFTSNSPITLTLPSGLRSGFNTTGVQNGSGQITAAGASVFGRNGLKSAGQYAAMSILSNAANTFIVSGDTTP